MWFLFFVGVYFIVSIAVGIFIWRTIEEIFAKLIVLRGKFGYFRYVIAIVAGLLYSQLLYVVFDTFHKMIFVGGA